MSSMTGERSMAVSPAVIPLRVPVRRAPPISSAALGMLIFVATEVMFFAAMISAYLIVRSGVPGWPPPGQPRLPIEVTAVNTANLLLSGFLLHRAWNAFREAPTGGRARRSLELAALFGTLFVLVQGVEWVRLLGHGLTLSSSVYGSFFYLIIGTHALHAAAGATALIWAGSRLRRGALIASALNATQIFWYFVVGVWPILYGLVYLS